MRYTYTADPSATCTTCGRALNAPYRRIVAGAIVEGCVDDAHTGHLPATTNTAAWHDRAEARKIRADTAASRKALGLVSIPAGHVVAL